MNNGRSSNKRWQEAEIRLAVELSEQGIGPIEISRTFSRRFDSKRTPAAISSFLCSYRAENNGHDQQCLANTLENYDRIHLLPSLEKREALVHKTLKFQADRLRRYDLHTQQSNQYANRQLGDLLSLPQDERSKIARILTGTNQDTQAPPIDTIDLLMFSPHMNADNISLVMPIYPQDIEVPSRSLRSALHDLTLAVCFNSGVFQHPSEQSRSTWHDLARYDLTYSDNPNHTYNFGEAISNELRKEYDSTVKVHVDNLLSNKLPKEYGVAND